MTGGKSLMADNLVPDDGIRAGTLHPCPEGSITSTSVLLSHGVKGYAYCVFSMRGKVIIT